MPTRQGKPKRRKGVFFAPFTTTFRGRKFYLLRGPFAPGRFRPNENHPLTFKGVKALSRRLTAAGFKVHLRVELTEFGVPVIYTSPLVGDSALRKLGLRTGIF